MLVRRTPDRSGECEGPKPQFTCCLEKKGQCSCSVQHRTHPVTTGLARPLHTRHQCALAETCKVLTLGRRVRCTSLVFIGHIRCMQSCSTESTTLSSRKRANSQMFCQRRKSRVSIFQCVFKKKLACQLSNACRSNTLWH